MKLEKGKVYKLMDDEVYYITREFVARFQELDCSDTNDIQHIFILPDGRTAKLRLQDWIVEEGSELTWVLS